MSKENLKECIRLKHELKKLKEYTEELPKQKSRYTKLEYKVRHEFYEVTYDDWLEMYKELKQKLTLIEKLKLVMK